MKLHPKLVVVFSSALLVCGLIGGGIATAQSSGIQIDLSQELDELRDNTTRSTNERSSSPANDNSSPTNVAPDVTIDLQLLTTEHNEISESQRRREIARLRAQCVEARTASCSVEELSSSRIREAGEWAQRERTKCRSTHAFMSADFQRCMDRVTDRTTDIANEYRDFNRNSQKRYNACIANLRQQRAFCAKNSDGIARSELPETQYPSWEETDETVFSASTEGLDKTLNERLRQQQHKDTCLAQGADRTPVCGCLEFYPRPEEAKACGV